MACGTPVVAFDTGGIRDAVRHMETGYLAKTGDTEDFAQGMHRLLTDDALRTQLGKNARTLIENEFSLEREISAFEKLYAELLQTKP